MSLNTNGSTPDEQQVVEQVLARAVQIATGNPDASARQGQAELTNSILEAMRVRGHHAAIAPTGSGKSFSALAPAMVRAVLAGERTAISTESLSLQDQIVTKDAPTVATAVQEVTGVTPTFAVHKGWSNYLCAKSVSASIEALTGQAPQKVGDFTKSLGNTAILDQGDELLSWAVEQVDNPQAPGDRHSVPLKIEQKDWDELSVSPDACIGVDKCPFATECKAVLARAKVADADIVVTNHSLLAVQASKGVNAVVGSKSLGRVDHLVVDEAHALVPAVRGAGAGEVSGSRLISVARGLKNVLADGTMVDQHVQAAEHFAVEIDGIVEQVLATHAKTFAPEQVAQVGESVRAWLRQVANLVRQVTASASDKGVLNARRYLSRLDSADADIATAMNPESQIARWAENDEKRGLSLKFSPVQVAGSISERLWNSFPATDEEAEALAELGIVDDQTGKYRLGVATISATLPRTFAGEAGVKSKVTEHPSPFMDAYASSALFVPQALSQEDVDALKSPFGGRGRLQLDTKRHSVWARGLTGQLVEASGGRALVLCATATDGKALVEYLRLYARGRWEVLSQWEGLSIGQLLQQWREDETSVLVGTRSLMTGVDAPGDTCRLVVIDRIPRSPSNPVDDARVKAFCESSGADKWTGDRSIYVGDASLLLEQAAGRLIRSTTDRGMVAVLDPRLLKGNGSKFNYPEPTRQEYLRALKYFDTKMSSLHEAKAFLYGLGGGA